MAVVVMVVVEGFNLRLALLTAAHHSTSHDRMTGEYRAAVPSGASTGAPFFMFAYIMLRILLAFIVNKVYIFLLNFHLSSSHLRIFFCLLLAPREVLLVSP
jgi:hypothetical protein